MIPVILDFIKNLPVSSVLVKNRFKMSCLIFFCFKLNFILVEVVGFEPTQSKDNGFTDRFSSPTLTYFHLSGKQDSNLQPLASKASKQPIVIFPVLTQIHFLRDSQKNPLSRFLSKNTCNARRI